MKIGFDAKRAFLNSSGLGNYSRNTLNALCHYFTDNEYILFTPEIKSGLFGNCTDFTIVTPKNLPKKLSSLWRSLFLLSLVKKHHLDIYHGLSNELPPGIAKSGIPSVVTIHDLIFLRYPGLYKPIDRKIYKVKFKYACKAATKIIAISNQTKNDLIAFFKIPSEKIEVIYQPVNALFYNKIDPGNTLKKYNIPEKYILTVGTIEPRKNQLSLIKGIYKTGIDLNLVIIGNPTSYTSQLKHFIKDKRIEEKVIFLNNLTLEELSAVYQNATLLAYISLFEGFGLPVIEAMASGCPVLTSSVDCLSETAGDAALLCDPYDITDISNKISYIINNNAFRNELIKKGNARAVHFHPGKYAEKLFSFYVKLLEQK